MSAAIEEVRALLRDFTKSQWLEIHFRAGSWEGFFAKTGAGPNRLLPTKSVKSAPSEKAVAITAPHLGLVHSLLSVGSQIAAGAVIARLDVLGRTTEVVAEAAGRVENWVVHEGALVEFNEPLLTMSLA